MTTATLTMDRPTMRPPAAPAPTTPAKAPRIELGRERSVGDVRPVCPDKVFGLSYAQDKGRRRPEVNHRGQTMGVMRRPMQVQVIRAGGGPHIPSPVMSTPSRVPGHKRGRGTPRRMAKGAGGLYRLGIQQSVHLDYRGGLTRQFKEDLTKDGEMVRRLSLHMDQLGEGADMEMAIGIYRSRMRLFHKHLPDLFDAQVARERCRGAIWYRYPVEDITGTPIDQQTI